ncbi:MAG: penicillin-binding transpeptidase domain-containing protein [Oscillospiraceae bacterium]|nr:penicillin-binding transpeptidase domain-containing protein [Oscillospiraceae bacterium]
MNLQRLNMRTYTIIGLLLAILAGFGIALVNIQIVHGAEYKALNAYSTSSVPIRAARGIILDRNGVPLVINESSLSMVFSAPFFPEGEERRELLAQLIALFDAEGADWIDMLPIALDGDGAPVFEEGRERDIEQLKSKSYLNLNPYATARECLNALIARYKLEDYDDTMARKIASVQYNMWRLQYSAMNPYTFAKDVNESLKSRVRENSAFYRGVRTEVVPVRTYMDGTVAPHLLGRVAAINQDDYQANKDKGYKITDEFGVSGIERTAESWLRGAAGLKTVKVDNTTGAADEIIELAAKQGKTVVLTIDSALQKLIEEAFPKYMEERKANRHPGVPAAGAVVVLDARSCEVLACVSYPGYDISQYQANMGRLNTDATAPLWNRALQGTYEPGSTIKVSVALAALQEGIITKDYQYRCTGAYPFLGHVFHCPQVYLHGGKPVNVVRALVDSCNSFFFEMGRQLGYAKINEYRLAMGLGQATGVELPEQLGVMDSQERRISIGQQWYAGYNLQTAIGQGNLFTPMQMAVYASTIANSGVRRRAHFIQSIREPGTNEPIEVYAPIILGDTGVDKAAYDVVRGAMLELGTGSTTAGRYFANLPVKVAGKTGTSQVIRVIDGKSQAVTNGLFISFAPFDNPEIVVIAIGEGCKSSEPVIPIVRDVYQYYFGSLSEVERAQGEGVLLG